jgi:hypothetical protein
MDISRYISAVAGEYNLSERTVSRVLCHALSAGGTASWGVAVEAVVYRGKLTVTRGGIAVSPSAFSAKGIRATRAALRVGLVEADRRRGNRGK